MHYFAALAPLTQAALVGATATIVAAFVTAWAVRRAAPALEAEAPELEPRLSDVERQQLGWTRLLDYYEDHDRVLSERLTASEARGDRLELELATVRAELDTARHPRPPRRRGGE